MIIKTLQLLSSFIQYGSLSSFIKYGSCKAEDLIPLLVNLLDGKRDHLGKDSTPDMKAEFKNGGRYSYRYHYYYEIKKQ